MWRLKALFALAIALLPSFLKISLYRRWYGYQIGRGVRIGFSPLCGVRFCRIGDNTTIGSLNCFFQVERLEIGSHVQIGFGNLFRGGQRIALGDYATVLRLNVFNAIVDGDFLNPAEAVLEVGPGAVVTSQHWLDFSERITLGAHSIIGGRASSLWTHNRQRTKAIAIGHHCYLGSEVRLAPGVTVAPLSIVALGSVITGYFGRERILIGGNPAVEQRPLKDREIYLVCYRTRKDIPAEVSRAELPEELWSAVSSPPSKATGEPGA